MNRKWVPTNTHYTSIVANILTTHFQIDNFTIIYFNRNNEYSCRYNIFLHCNQPDNATSKNNNADAENNDEIILTLTEMLKQLPASWQHQLLRLSQMMKLVPQCLQLHWWGWVGQLPHPWDSDCKGRLHCQLCSSAVDVYYNMIIIMLFSDMNHF